MPRLLVLLSLLSPILAWALPTVPPTREIPSGTLDLAPIDEAVSFATGGYAPRIPLEVLPGRNGRTPDISLVYNQGVTNGPMGPGWQFGFESVIERRSQYGGVPEFTTSDIFLVDGERLVEEADGTFRKRSDDGTVFRRYTVSGAYTGFTATRNWQRWTYGYISTTTKKSYQNSVDWQSETASVTGTSIKTSGTNPVRWRLSIATDAFNVSTTYTYLVHQLSNPSANTYRHVPYQLSYTPASGVTNKITFEYETRGTSGSTDIDVYADYSDGMKRLEGQRLRRIYVTRTSGGTTTYTHYYVLAYARPSHTNHSLLQEVKRLATSATATPSKTTAGEDGWSDTITLARFAYDDTDTTYGAIEPIDIPSSRSQTAATIPAPRSTAIPSFRTRTATRISIYSS